MAIETGDLIGPIQTALEGAAAELYGSGQQVADEDREFFAEQAKLLADLTRDLANAGSDADRMLIVGAMEQQVTTVEMRVTRRRFRLSQEATEQLKRVLTIATQVVVDFLRKIVLG